MNPADKHRLRTWLEYVIETAIGILDDLDASTTDLEDDELGDDLTVGGGGVMSPLDLAMTRSRPFPPSVGDGYWFITPPLYRSTIERRFEEGFAGRDSDVVVICKPSCVGLTEISLAWDLWALGRAAIGGEIIGVDWIAGGEGPGCEPGSLGYDDTIVGPADPIVQIPPHRRGRFKRNARRARK